MSCPKAVSFITRYITKRIVLELNNTLIPPS